MSLSKRRRKTTNEVCAGDERIVHTEPEQICDDDEVEEEGSRKAREKKNPADAKI